MSGTGLTLSVETMDTLGLSAQGVGLRANMRRMPAPETAVRMIASTFLVSLVMLASSLKRKKARRFPMKEEDMFIAQKTPEFLVIVLGSELFARKLP